MPELTAFCWNDGTIAFAEDGCPDGALAIAKHEDHDLLRKAIDVCATHGYEPGHLIVGSVRSAKMFGDDPVDALIDFVKHVKMTMKSMED